MKILFIKHPRNKISIYGDSNLEPLEFEILAAPLKGYHDVSILDMRLEDNRLASTLRELQPQVVGLTGYTTDVYSILDIAKKIKNYDPDIKIVVGGVHASLLPHDFYHPVIDLIVIGDGDITFQEVVAGLEKGKELENIPGIAINRKEGQILTPKRQVPKDLNIFPIPDRNLTQKYRSSYFSGIYRPTATIIASRGCPFKCKFCSIWKFMDSKYLTRNIKTVANELEQIKEPYVSFIDDNLTSNFKHFEALSEEIRQRGIQKRYRAFGRTDAIARRPDLIEKWSKIGLVEMSLGLESIKDAGLKLLNKQNTVENNLKAINILKENGIKIKAYFIIRPDFEAKDFEELSKFVEEMEIENPNFTVLTPLPGSALYEELKDKICIRNYEFYDLAHAVLPTKLPRKEFYDNFMRLYSSFNSPKRYITYIFQKFISRLSINPVKIPLPLSLHKVLFWSVSTAIFSKKRYKQELAFISKDIANTAS